MLPILLHYSRYALLIYAGTGARRDLLPIGLGHGGLCRTLGICVVVVLLLCLLVLISVEHMENMGLGLFLDAVGQGSLIAATALLTVLRLSPSTGGSTRLI